MPHSESPLPRGCARHRVDHGRDPGACAAGGCLRMGSTAAARTFRPPTVKGPPPVTSQDDQLDALYGELPPMECRGKCTDSCGSVAMTQPENDRIRRAGVALPLLGAFGAEKCPALTGLGLCSVHPVRPMICRLWGMTARMRCPHGCRPEGGHLTDQQAYYLLARAAEIAGELELANRFRRVAVSAPVR